MPRPEYPRPQFVREDWLNLNGTWDFAFDDADRGVAERWFLGEGRFDRTIVVPFAYQSKLSGIGTNAFHDIVWYRRTFRIPERFRDKRVLLHFGAVDYEASVWVNGTLVAVHEGGHTPFCADITEALGDRSADQLLVVRARDDNRDVALPRGKQYWRAESASIFYTRTTGIWQTVWLEFVSPFHLRRVKMTPDIDRHQLELSAFVSGAPSDGGLKLKVTVSFGGDPVSEDVWSIRRLAETRSIELHDFGEFGQERLWSPEQPNLYDIAFTLTNDDGTVVFDRVTSYFGMRKISIENGKFCLNNLPYYQKLVLDQGYFPDGILTAPSDEAIRQDIELAKRMGFNGARKHQKLEDPRWLYWCDRLGFLVWSEAANAFGYSEAYVRRFVHEWQASVERDYNHPCIAVWVPLNESWGVPAIRHDKRQQHHALTMYHLTKSLDPTRPVVSNDGWEMVTTDLLSIHDYEWREQVLAERYRSLDSATNAMPGGRPLTVEGYPYAGQPVLVTEFGGIAYKKSEWEGWGYSGADSDEDFEARLRAVFRPIQESPVIQGYCYTQLTDVEQEINGLVTCDRVPKIPIEKIRAINEGR